jgi:hypothetical protein
MSENQINSKQPAGPINRLLFAVLSVLSLTCVSQETEGMNELNIVPPENWYQVELIVFTQDGNTQGELPPEQVELAFPNKLTELVNAEELALKVENAIEGALLPEPRTDEVVPLIPIALVQDPYLETELAPLTSQLEPMEQLESPENEDFELPSMENFVAEYEDTLVTLTKEFRNLNDSARLLRRRNYGVIFHQAWRFIAEKDQDQPWLLFKAGGSPQGRAEVEGAVRFYKSRFLHFQAELWRLNFSDDPEFVGLKVDLPEPPLIDLPEGTPASWRLVPMSMNESLDHHPESVASLLAPAEGEIPLLLNNDVTAGEISNRDESESTPPANKVVDLSASEYQLERYDPRIEDRENSNKNRITPPIRELWPIRMAKRIEEDKVYYLDHPEVGVMVTIKSYQPQPINLPTVDQTKTIDGGTTD